MSAACAKADTAFRAAEFFAGIGLVGTSPSDRGDHGRLRERH